MNCNCFTPKIKDLPTGEIPNILYTDYDLQVPKILGKVMGIVPKDGFDQNLCVNRGVNQDVGFVGRLLHPPSGTMVEIYSNQPGVNLNTANSFGYGDRMSLAQILPPPVQNKPPQKELEEKLLLFKKVHEEMFDV
ncbi:unnamed protein product [Brassicogethes aeneus]|uniref:Uncharacterized protein n=1 Tax=Brassicogethes aeneus TaxID=1431903 RepID=A0A9P0BHA4_BRAAE|nr:unnamed protein product [Brassicogethes aeneus]